MSGVRERAGLPLVLDFQVACPAGTFVGETPKGSGCRCCIAHETVCTHTDPASLVKFCANDPGYKRCPTWIAEKERIAAERREPLVQA